jgi:hypothetical protein
VNLGFALAITLGTGPVAEASASPVAFDPSPVMDGLAAARVRVTSTVLTRGLDRYDRLAVCESGRDPAAVSPGGRYRGAFQFSLPTWRAAGGAGDPVDASYTEQKRVTMGWAQAVEPSTQWPVCWRRTS